MTQQRCSVIAVVVATALAGCGQTPPPPPKPVAVEVITAVTPETPTRSADSPAAPSLDTLRAALSAAADEDTRVRAVDAIAALGPNARGAFDDLVAATTDASGRVRWHAARGLGLIGEDAVAAVPVLVNLLDDADPIVATQAAAAIGLIRADDESVNMPAADDAAYDAASIALVSKMTHPDPRVRRAVLRAIAKLEPDVERLAPLVSERLADADPSVVLPALHSLADMGGDAVPFLVKALENPASRYWATVGLAEIGAAAAPAVPQLQAGVSTGGTEERMQSIMTLAAIGEPALGATGDIVKALDAPESPLRFAAAFALGRLRAKDADAALGRAADDADPLLAAIASWARARIHPDDAALVNAAVEKLTAGLSSPTPGVQTAAISAISDLVGSIDDATEKRIADEFVRLLASGEPDVREAAAAALVREGPLAVDALEKSLGDPAIRGIAMEILTAIGPVSKGALDSFITALSDPDPAHRGDAAIAIAAIGQDAAEAVPQLAAMLSATDGPPGVRYAAAYALGRIGPAAKPAAAALAKLASSDDELMATVATWASLKIEPGNTALFQSAVPLLRKALRGGEELARLEAAVALGDIGAAASEAVPILELVSEEDPAPAVRAAASRALVHIRGVQAPTRN
ncbi:MAG: HEAT repeat domain-containing protein [Planctomycetia bacterium]